MDMGGGAADGCADGHAGPPGCWFAGCADGHAGPVGCCCGAGWADGQGAAEGCWGAADGQGACACAATAQQVTAASASGSTRVVTRVATPAGFMGVISRSKIPVQDRSKTDPDDQINSLTISRIRRYRGKTALTPGGVPRFLPPGRAAMAQIEHFTHVPVE
jgi:hypothetical protein